MSARDDLFHRLVVEGGLSPHWANRQIDAFAHELAEKIREAQFGTEGNTWNWWDAATIPEECAKVIDPEVEK